MHQCIQYLEHSLTCSRPPAPSHSHRRQQQHRRRTLTPCRAGEAGEEASTASTSGSSPSNFLPYGLATAGFCGCLPLTPIHPASSLLTAATVLYTGYSSSWLTLSPLPHVSKHPLVLQLNASRKAWCTALNASHLALLAAIAWAFLSSEWLIQAVNPVLVPLAVAASVSVFVQGAIELQRKQISKAVALKLDELPGQAHPIMVQGAQSAAKSFTWVFLVVIHSYLLFSDGLSVQWDSGLPSVLSLVLLLVAGGVSLWAGEQD